MEMGFSNFGKDGKSFTLSDIAFALEILANGEGIWNPTEDEDWNRALMDAARVLRAHQKSREGKHVN